MHVLYFHQHFSTPAGGAGTRSYEFSRRLAAQGHQVTIVCGSYRVGSTGLTGPFERGRRRGLVDGIDVIEFDLSYGNEHAFVRRAMAFVSFAFRSASVAITNSADIVFATTTPLTSGIPGILARWLRGKPFVFEVRDLWPELPRAMGVITNPLALAALGLLEWSSYRSAHACVALAPGIADGIARLGVTRDRIAIIPNGCDIDLFGSVDTSDTDVPLPGVQATDLVAAYTGTHGLANGLDAALDAASELRRRGRHDIKLLFVGSGMEKAKLEERARREALDNCVFVEGMPKTALVRLMARADVGMQLLADVPAFYYGTSPNKFFDYLAQAKPVLVNYPGWVADMVERADCGWAVPPCDPGAFANALEDAHSRRDELSSLGQNALVLARTMFSRNALADDFREVLERVAEGRTTVSDIGAQFRSAPGGS